MRFDPSARSSSDRRGGFSGSSSARGRAYSDSDDSGSDGDGESVFGSEGPSSPEDVSHALHEQINDKPYKGPVMDALLLPSVGAGSTRFQRRAGTAYGLPLEASELGPARFNVPGQGASGTAAASVSRIMPLHDGDLEKITAARRSSAGALTASPEEAADELRRAVITRRAIRATYSEEQAAAMTRAFIVQHGRDLEPVPFTPGADPDNMMAVRTQEDYQKGEDPLEATPLPFNAAAVTMISNLTWNAAPGHRALDAKATITARVTELGLSKAARQYIKLLAGTRYNATSGLLKFSSEAHPSAAANKREVLERLVSLVKEANSLADKFGSCEQKVNLPAYCH